MIKGEDIITSSSHYCSQDETRDVFRQNWHHQQAMKNVGTCQSWKTWPACRKCFAATLHLFTPCPLSVFNHNRLQVIWALTNSTPKMPRTVLQNP